MEISKLKGRKIVFDTSAINYLLDSPEKLEGFLRQQDACIYSVLLTETMMAEVVATKNENRRQRHSDCCRLKVLNGQPGHLGKVAHRRFTGIRLPVSICDERDRRIEREMFRKPCKALRI